MCVYVLGFYFLKVRPRYMPSTLFTNDATEERVVLLLTLPTAVTTFEMNSAILSALKESCMSVKPSLQLILNEVYLLNLLLPVS